MHKKSLLSLTDLSKTDILNIIESKNISSTLLKNKNFALLFDKPSLRTRSSFEIAITELGGFSSNILWSSANFAKGDLADEAQVLGDYYDGLVIRISSHTDLAIIKDAADANIINAMTNYAHPCQALADIVTIKETTEDWLAKKLVFLGPATNVSNSLAIICDKIGLDFKVCCPSESEPNNPFFRDCVVIHNVEEALSDADYIYTDAWIGIGDEKDNSALKTAAMPYQLNQETLAYCKKSPFLMNCMPITYGNEIVSREFMQENRSIIFEQAKNRIVAQKNLLNWIYS